MRQLTLIQAREMNRPEPRYSSRALERLCDYRWPGNVRELKNLVKRMVILRAGDRISAEDVEKIIESARPQGQRATEDLLEPEGQRATAHREDARPHARGLGRQPRGAARSCWACRVPPSSTASASCASRPRITSDERNPEPEQAQNALESAFRNQVPDRLVDSPSESHAC